MSVVAPLVEVCCDTAGTLTCRLSFDMTGRRLAVSSRVRRSTKSGFCNMRAYMGVSPDWWGMRVGGGEEGFVSDYLVGFRMPCSVVASGSFLPGSGRWT